MQDSEPVTRLLDRLEAVRRAGDGWTARCPAHEDQHASLSVGEGRDGRALLKCFSGCTVEDIVAAVGLELADLFSGRGNGAVPPGNRSTAQHLGCTLSAYGAAKRLPLDFLRAVGLSEIAYQGAPAVRIPYLGGDGAEVAVRFRVALETGGDRFRWKRDPSHISTA